MFNLTKISDSAKYAFIASLILLLFVFGIYTAVEPSVSRAVTDNFTISQNITDEISFLVAAADVQMQGSISGITGGTATGSTYTVVRTNDAQGYNMTMAFSNSPAMISTTTSDVIFDYKYAAGSTTPDYDFVASSSAIFGFTINASTTSDVDPSFQNNGAFCGSGGSTSYFKCWGSPSTTPETIINRNTSASDGATTTITFRVNVPSSPSPSLEAAFYTATATLTAVNN